MRTNGSSLDDESDPAAQDGRRIPRTTDEHLLRDVETLFALEFCRLCRGRFPAERRQAHLDYHYDLFVEHAPLRARLEWLRREQEKRTCARLVCETPGMPVVSERQLRRHERLHGPDGIEQLLPHIEKSRTCQPRPATHGEKRPLLRASAEDNGYPWVTPRTQKLGRKIVALHRRGRDVMAIADAVGKSDRVVRRYLREATVRGAPAA
jgi:hypothetical protein